MTKKKYNPFKMWGSYVGAILLSIYGIFDLPNWYCQIVQKVIDENTVGICNTIPNTILFITLSVAVGFLLGWSIHSLIRAIRK